MINTTQFIMIDMKKFVCPKITVTVQYKVYRYRLIFFDRDKHRDTFGIVINRSFGVQCKDYNIGLGMCMVIIASYILYYTNDNTSE